MERLPIFLPYEALPKQGQAFSMIGSTTMLECEPNQSSFGSRHNTDLFYRFVDCDMFMQFLGIGIGHKSQFNQADDKEVVNVNEDQDDNQDSDQDWGNNEDQSDDEDQGDDDNHSGNDDDGEEQSEDDNEEQSEDDNEEQDEDDSASDEDMGFNDL